MLRDRQIPTVTGRNMGIAWNKNRALFLLSELLRCDVMLLLEDDTHPIRDNWEIEWMNAAISWGHVNVASERLRAHFVAGSGTLADPIRGTHVTAKCAAFSREALLFGGYFDPRFRGYGHEHVEHSSRLAAMGYGAVEEPVNGTNTRLFYLLWGGVQFNPLVTSHYDKEQVERNLVLAGELMGDVRYRAPWSDENEGRQFREEMRGRIPRPGL
jgi:hypothetical protein